MTEYIKEKDVWQALKETNKPILLYGMGDGADRIIEVLDEKSIAYSDIFASDGFVRGQIFHNKKVISLSQAKEKYKDFVIVTTFAVHNKEMIETLHSLSKEFELYSPTVELENKELFSFDYVKKHNTEFDETFALLADELSKKTFVDVLNFKVSGKIDYLLSCQSNKSEVYENILRLGEDERIVDLGAYDGDTIREFLSFTNGRYSHITAFEPDKKNFLKLERKTADYENIDRFNLGAWNTKETLYFKNKAARSSKQDNSGTGINFNSVDNVVKGGVTFIKMDIEGAELKALEGAKKTIEKYKPKLYVCAYHRNEDFFTLIKKIHSLCSDYKIYLRHHPYIPAWETNIYAVI